MRKHEISKDNYYAEVDLELPCKLSEAHFIDYTYCDCEASNLDYQSNRFELFTKEGFYINPYSLKDAVKKGILKWEDIIVIDLKLSKYAAWYIGHILKLKTNLPRFIGGKDLSPYPAEIENYENYYDCDHYAKL